MNRFLGGGAMGAVAAVALYLFWYVPSQPSHTQRIVTADMIVFALVGAVIGAFFFLFLGKGLWDWLMTRPPKDG